jgi:DNA-binding CsgD family transcriptional regulator
MPNVETLLHTAWLHVAARFADDPHDLARRIARRRRAVLIRPPRAWCLAVRASDARLADVTTIDRANTGDDASSCHSLTLSPRYREHVRLTTAALQTLCAPVTLTAPGETLREVANKLGTTPMGLHAARLNNRFHVHHVKGLSGSRGRPVPVLYTDRPLDPSAKNFAEPDPAWLWTATYIVSRIPRDFAQTLTRIECHRSHVARTRYAEHVHPEARDGVTPPRPKRLLPPPEPDHVWYKWSRSGHFLGDDPSNWRKSPNDPGDRPPRYLKRYKPKPKPKPSTSAGSLHFNGYAWLCPICGKTCRTIYLPVRRLNLLDLRDPNDRAARSKPPKLADIVEIPRAIQRFACARCHRVKFFTRVANEAWNDLIAYLTAGLLYGREVPRPEWFTKDRKRAYVPRPTAAPSKRRLQVLELLLKGLSYAEIGQQLGLSERTINDYAGQIYAQHGVGGRHARADLARKLGSPAPPKRETKRDKVRRLLLAGDSYKDIAATLGLTRAAVRHHACNLHKLAPAATPSATPIPSRGHPHVLL